MVERRIDNFDPGTIAESGQCFRMRKAADGAYTLIAGERFLRLWQTGEGRFAFDCDEAAFDVFWRPYFDLDTDYGAYISAIPPEDAYLQRAAAHGQGMRILRQDAWEMLVTFILSQRKNIPAIRTCVETLCTRFGKMIACAGGMTRHAFPSAEALANAGETQLRACGLGYRAPYVLSAAQSVSSGALDLQAMRQLADDALLDALMTVPGVGVKVASCVLLFGFGRKGTFPRDVWIERILAAEYGGAFPVERYAGFAGVMQQYLFYYGRQRG